MTVDRITRIRGAFERQFKNSSDLSNSFVKQIIGDNVIVEIGTFEGKYAIAVEGDFKQLDLTSTSLIDVQPISDSLHQGIVFTLLDEELLDIYIQFAYDLELLVKKDKSVQVGEVYNRYIFWQKMFKKVNQNISESIVKGLANELNLLLKYFIPTYGVTPSIKAWIGAENAHKDFAFTDGKWFEAKAINVGKNTVDISSLEQLESESIGYLTVSELEKTSPENEEGMNLINLINLVKDQIENEMILGEFYNKIVQLGFDMTITIKPEHKANTYRYILNDANFYKVDDLFPRLKKTDFSNAIASIKYSLLLTELEEFKIDYKDIEEGKYSGT
ncbi:hypothetical protein IGK74_001713 [Enterococcus sp. AZ150]|uniref:PD-(D/E)XK motif protein n=1 Tax=Enterococcus sp. AZ150 TaxID=2774866 RepID=UPI003F1E69C8